LFVNIPFMHQMFITCLASIGIILLLSFLENRGKPDAKGIPLTKNLFRTAPAFNISATIIMIILVALYALFW